MNPNGYSQYQENNIMTASPAKLLLMAYDGAIRFCRISGEKMKENNYEEQSFYINKALAVIFELVSTLREDVAPEIVANLRSLYTYVIEKLAHANLNQDEKALEEAIHILSQLRESWAEAEKSLAQQTEGPGEETTDKAA